MITEQEWNSIRTVVERICAEVSGRRQEFFQTGKVIKRDEVNRLVWIKGMGHTAIPIVSFNYDIRYYDTDELGNATVKNARAKIAVPKLGEIVLVVFELGSTRLPRCLGVVQGKNYLETEED